MFSKSNKFFPFFSMIFFSFCPSVLKDLGKDSAIIDSVPTLQTNPVGQSTGFSSMDPCATTGAVEQPRQCPSTAAKAGKESLACDENWCVDVFQDVERTCSTLVKRLSSFLDHLFGSCHRWEAVTAGPKGHLSRGKTRTGGRRSCTWMVLFLLAATLLMAAPTTAAPTNGAPTTASVVARKDQVAPPNVHVVLETYPPRTATTKPLSVPDPPAKPTDEFITGSSYVDSSSTTTAMGDFTIPEFTNSSFIRPFDLTLHHWRNVVDGNENEKSRRLSSCVDNNALCTQSYGVGCNLAVAYCNSPQIGTYVRSICPVTCNVCCINGPDDKPCENSGECTGLKGSSECTCTSSFAGVHCEEVFDPNKCYTASPKFEGGPNEQNCLNGGTATGTKDTACTCVCTAAYFGSNCQNHVDWCQQKINSGVHLLVRFFLFFSTLIFF